MALLSIFDISASALTAQSQRLNVSASNMANAESIAGPDGQPYRAKQVVFQMAPQGRHELIEDPTPPRMEYKPGHPSANEKGYVQMPNVDMVGEMINTISASRSYQANLEVMNTAKTLLQKTLTIGQ